MDRSEDLAKQLDAVYAERNLLAGLVVRLAQHLAFKCGVGEDKDPNCEQGWRTVIFVELPSPRGCGKPYQLSWHIPDAERWQFERLPKWTGQWDGHTTEEKLGRISELILRSNW